MSVIEKNTQLIKSFAAKQGFNYCGIAKAELLTEDAKRLESWLNKGMHGTMQYMENHFDMRIDPSKTESVDRRPTRSVRVAARPRLAPRGNLERAVVQGDFG